MVSACFAGSVHHADEQTYLPGKLCLSLEQLHHIDVTSREADRSFTSEDNAMNVIVFGATGGVGSATVRELKAHQHAVLLAGRNAEKIETLHQETGFPVALFQSESSKSVGDVFAKAKTIFGEIDGVISCIGTFPMMTLDRIDEEKVLRDVVENIRVTLSILVGAKQHLKRNAGVVFLSSVVTRRGAPAHVPIGASKGAIEVMARNAAAELARQGVRVNSLALGLTKTEATKRIWSKEGAAEKMAGLYPLGFNEPEDVAKAVAFLLETPGITGQTLAMDGGFSALYAS